MIHSEPWRRLCAVAALLFVVGWDTNSDAPGQDQKQGKKYALLVGIDRYGKGTLLPTLTYPGRDVDGLAEVLFEARYSKDDVVLMTRRTGFDDVDLLPNARSDPHQLDLMLKLLKPNDSILVLLTGHGVMMDAASVGAASSLAASSARWTPTSECGISRT